LRGTGKADFQYLGWKHPKFSTAERLRVVYSAHSPRGSAFGADGKGCGNSGTKKYYVVLTMDEKTIKAINAILKRGSDVEIRRKGDGYIVLEVKRSIKYSA